jgi:HlyD family secretion protein
MSNLENGEIQETLNKYKSTNSFKKYLFIILILLVLGASFYAYFLSKNKEVVHYNTTSATRGDLLVSVSATGNLEPTNKVDVGIEVSGTILNIYVDYNDKVKKGQILAKLDTTKLESQVNSTQAALNVAKANLLESQINIKDAQRELQRAQKLSELTKGKYPSSKDMDAALITYERSKAIYAGLVAKEAQAEALLESNQEDLKKAIVLSPIDGVVLNRAVEVGQSVVANMQIPILFTLAQDLKKMQVVVSVDEADVGEVKKGQEVTFSVDAYPNATFKGRIEQVRINSVVVNNVVTYETVVAVNNEDLRLLPGMTVSADITTKLIKDALLVPNAALRFSPPAKKEESKGFSLFKRVSSDTSDLSTHSKNLWVLRDNTAVPIAINLQESDGVHSVVSDTNLSLDDKIITGIQESSK